MTKHKEGLSVVTFIERNTNIYAVNLVYFRLLVSPVQADSSGQLVWKSYIQCFYTVSALTYDVSF